MIKAIETRYAGCRFRSRLEARHAVFFDTLGIRWEYEPQGFELQPLTPQQLYRHAEFWDPGNGEKPNEHLGYYLPDFWLPEQELWLEIKGAEPSEHEWQRFFRFTELCDHRVMLAAGSPPDPRAINDQGHPYARPGEFDIYWGGDFHYAWTRCRTCGFYDIAFDARSARTHCRCHTYPCPYGSCNGDKCYNGDEPTIIAAYAAARSARFEHGESGA